MKTSRSYTMTARADAVEATRTAILEALVALSERRLFREIALDDVAAEAGVSVQTVLRHFGNRGGLFEAGADRARADVVAERHVTPGDAAEAVRVIVEHYEARGDAVLLLLAQEQGEELAARIVRDGRALHRRWVEDTFAPQLAGVQGEREEAVDLLVVATDVFTWKLLRRDRGLSRERTRQRMDVLVGAVLTGLGGPGEGA